MYCLRRLFGLHSPQNHRLIDTSILNSKGTASREDHLVISRSSGSVVEYPRRSLYSELFSCIKVAGAK
jgi:hypothetical protein